MVKKNDIKMHLRETYPPKYVLKNMKYVWPWHWFPWFHHRKVIKVSIISRSSILSMICKCFLWSLNRIISYWQAWYEKLSFISIVTNAILTIPRLLDWYIYIYYCWFVSTSHVHVAHLFSFLCCVFSLFCVSVPYVACVSELPIFSSPGL